MNRKVSGQSIVLATSMPLDCRNQATNLPTFRRKGSIKSMASMMTERSSNNRRQTVIKAVLAVDKSETNVNEIADMLLTLKRKDLATCLFNQVFLKSKIKLAKEALDIFHEAPPEEEKKRASSTDKKTKTDIDRFLLGLKELTTYEKKQVMGERLFPMVKV